MTNFARTLDAWREPICYHTAQPSWEVAEGPWPIGLNPSGGGSEEEDRETVARVSYEQAYPGIMFRPSSRNWWAWLKGVPAECVHLDAEQEWMVSLVPDTLYLRGKAAIRRKPMRPEVCLCRDCLTGILLRELAGFPGRVVAYEPDAAFSQYFFVAAPDFEPAGLKPEVAAAIQLRLGPNDSSCVECSRRATWLWFSRDQVESLDNVAAIEAAPGENLCAAHGAQRLCSALEAIDQASVFYMNLPYGESGAYVWI